MRPTLIVLMLVVAPLTATGQHLQCSGRDPEAAQRAQRISLSALESARAAEGAERERLAELSLASAREQCLMGDPGGLVRMASALHMLGRYAEAARTLDAYLIDHPITSHVENLQDSLRDSQASIDPLVTRILVSSSCPGTRLRVGGSVVSSDGRTHYVPRGRVRIEVTAPGFGPVVQTINVDTPVRTLVVRDSQRTSGDSADIVLQRSESPPQLLLGAEPGETTAVPAMAPARAHPIRPWFIGTAVLSGALAVVGVSALAWREARATTYGELGCGPARGDEVCRSAFADIGAAMDLSIASLVLAGAAAGGAVALWYFDQRSPSSARASRGCSVILTGGVRCSF